MSRPDVRGPWRGTLRWRLTLLATAIVAAVLVVSAFGLVTVQERLLTHGVDESLVQRADNIEKDVARGAYGTVLPSEGDREDSFLQLVDENDHVLASSPNVNAQPAFAAALPPGAARVIRTVPDIPLSSHEFRVLVRPVPTDQGATTLVVGKNLDDVNESVSILRASLGVSIPVVLMLLAGLVWWLTGRVLRPVEAIRAEVASIGGTELDRRVPVDGTYDEISRLARTMNAMLDRVQHATDRQRQFVADASHELRSPLARIRAALEIGIAHPDDTDPDTTFRNLLNDATQLQQLVDDLLFLARSESGTLVRPDTAVDLDDLVLEQVKQLRSRGKVRVDAKAVSAARVRGDANQLSRAIGNLASNAERYARSTVVFELGEHNGHSELVVADDGPGIRSEDHETVFKRFTRLDAARSRDSGGAGLGLAIVSDIVARHEGTIAITDSDRGGARFVMRLPRAD